MYTLYEAFYYKGKTYKKSATIFILYIPATNCQITNQNRHTPMPCICSALGSILTVSMDTLSVGWELICVTDMPARAALSGSIDLHGTVSRSVINERGMRGVVGTVPIHPQLPSMPIRSIPSLLLLCLCGA